MSQTKIICTIGPASETPETLKAMMLAGMNVARLNFSHGTHNDHQRRLDTVREVSREIDHEVKILLDLEGLRVRIGDFEDRNQTTITIKPQQTVILSNQKISFDHEIIPLDYHGSMNVISPNDCIYIDDGNIALKAIEVADNFAKCEVIVGGAIKEHKGVNIPGADFPSQGLSDKDRFDLEFGIKNEVDFIAQSFVRRKEDITIIREILNRYNVASRMISKIENREGINNLDDIVEVSDSIMIARGDLGVSLPIYEIPILQKKIIKQCNSKKKIAITATQMLESMTENLRPTRAEVSDVANAVLDGTDYVMLSGETAVGRYPIETVRMMRKIIDFTEGNATESDLTSYKCS